MSNLTDLGRKLDRAAYDLARSLVKLEEIQQHPEMPTNGAIAETQKHLSDVRIIVGQIERLDVLQEARKVDDSTG